MTPHYSRECRASRPGGSGREPILRHVILLLAGILVALPLVGSAAVAQWLDPARKWEERDAQGRRTGSIEPSSRGYVERDAQGRRIGSGEYGSSGTIIERDAQGRRTGTIEPGPGGSWVHRDAQGRRTGTERPR